MEKAVLSDSLPKKKHFPALLHASLLPQPCGLARIETYIEVKSKFILIFIPMCTVFYGNYNRALEKLLVCFQSAKKEESRKLLFSSCPATSVFCGISHRQNVSGCLCTMISGALENSSVKKKSTSFAQ